jgi:transporter family-2 protein
VLMFLTLIIGAMIPAQAVLNTRLGRQMGGSLMGSLMSFTTGIICLIVLNLTINPSAVIQLKPTATGPWYLWLGGVLGAIFVGYITWVNQQQGVALTFALVVRGQIFMSLIIDQYGLFGSMIQPITLEKIIGAALIIAGLILIKK